VARATFASSAAVYGEAASLPIGEGSPAAPVSPYGASKLEAERLAAAAAGPGLQVVALRYFNVFGPRQALSGGYPALVAALAVAAATGSAFTRYGDGRQTRDLVAVSDVARANRLALERPLAESFLAANVGTGVERSLLDAAAAIEAASGRPIGIVAAPDRPGDVRRSVADASLAAARLGWRAERGFLDAVAETYGYYARLHGRGLGV
jgi:UDP-glucose 4-epimerase